MLILIAFLIIQRSVVIPTEKILGKIPKTSSVWFMDESFWEQLWDQSGIWFYWRTEQLGDNPLPSCCSLPVWERRIGLVGAASGRRTQEEASRVWLAEQMEKSSSNLIFFSSSSFYLVHVWAWAPPPSLSLSSSRLPICNTFSLMLQHRLEFPNVHV